MNKALFKISSTRKEMVGEEEISMGFMHDFAKARGPRERSRGFPAEVKP
jgi:hypothetical protein